MKSLTAYMHARINTQIMKYKARKCIPAPVCKIRQLLVIYDHVVHFVGDKHLLGNRKSKLIMSLLI